MLTEEKLQHIARLAAIKTSDDELSGLHQDLNSILEYVNKLSEVNTNGVVPTSHVHGAINAFREDVPREPMERKTLEDLAPDFGDSGFRVPRVI